MVPTLGSWSSVYQDDPAWGSSGTKSRDNGKQTVEDTYDFRDRDNPFWLTRNTTGGGVIDGQLSRRYWGSPINYLHIREWTNYPSEFAHPSVSLLPEEESWESAALRAKNMTNPGRPEILLPTFLWELRDIPRMIRRLGDTNRYLRNRIRRPPSSIADTLTDVKKAAADNIATQFGWLPLLSDLRKLAMFQDAVERRRKELERLHSGMGLKRRVILDNRKETYDLGPQTAAIIDSNFWDVEGGTVVMTFKRWATVRYIPTFASPLPSMDAEIRRMLTGFHISALASNLWEAIPWSWLADYFSNIGDLCENSNNAAQVQCVSCCVMTHARSVVTIPSSQLETVQGTLRCSEYNRVHETKTRSLGIDLSLHPTVGLPILSGRQLSILGSFAVLRAGK
jgi:hypothetical protein